MVRVELKIAATKTVSAGKATDVELVHINRSAEDIAVAVCGEDRLLIDDHEGPMPSLEPCHHEDRMIKVGGAFVTRARVTLPSGRHLLRGRWREWQSDDAIVEVAP
jgi:hypothetical protein